MNKSVQRVLLVGMATVAVGLPVGAAWAATDDQPAPGVGWSESGPPSWAPEECQENADSPEMQQWREEHQAEMQAGRAERQAEMQAGQAERQALRQERVGDGVGPGRTGGAMWDRAES